MKNRKNNSQNGAISIFVMISMMFFLVTIVGIYMISSKRAQMQTQSVDLIQSQYYTEGEEDAIYNAKKAKETDKIPIYTKEHLWSIGEDKIIEIDGILYDFSETDLSKYELKNDIIINMETDLADSNFKDNLIYGTSTINLNNHTLLYYYENSGVKKYYKPVQYSDGTNITNLTNYTAALSASGTDFSNISTSIAVSGKYYLFSEVNLNE